MKQYKISEIVTPSALPILVMTIWHLHGNDIGSHILGISILTDSPPKSLLSSK